VSRWVSAIGLGGAFALCLSTAVAAGPFEDGQSAYNQGDYATAIKSWQPLAEAGDARAQYMLGLAYGLGRGVPRDYHVAAKWYGRAAEHGVVAAEINLGSMYANGLGVPQDYVQAITWWRKATD
jgi:TPR repeat protein